MRDPDDKLAAAERISGTAARPRTVPSESLDFLEAEANYTRERLQIYRAKRSQGRPLRGDRLRELERAAEGAAGRLRRARERADAKPE